MLRGNSGPDSNLGKSAHSAISTIAIGRHQSADNTSSSNLIGALQHSLSTMGLNEGAPASGPIDCTDSPASHQQHQPSSTNITATTTSSTTRRSLRPRPPPSVPLVIATSSTSSAVIAPASTGSSGTGGTSRNRRSISRPRKHSSISGAAVFALHQAATVTEHELLGHQLQLAPKYYGAAGSAGPDAAQVQRSVERFYMSANKSARVRSTLLETIAEAGADDEELAAADDEADELAAASATVTTRGGGGGGRSFLEVRKRKRFLSFAASAAHQQQHRAAARVALVQRRRRRIREKLGVVPGKWAKFSMEVFLTKMRGLQADAMVGEEGDVDGGDGGAAAGAGAGQMVDASGCGAAVTAPLEDLEEEEMNISAEMAC